MSQEMASQIIQAVDIAINGHADAALKSQAISFLNGIKDSQDGWQAFALLLKNVSNPAQVRFVALQAINDYIPTLSQEHNSFIRSSLFTYLQELIAANILDESYLKNKLAESFGSLFCVCYLTTWTSFFKDFEKLIQDENEISIDYYLRILLAVHSEIGDQLIVRERSLIDRNNNLKDAIRTNDMNELALIWKKILTDFRDSNSSLSKTILKETLQIIGGWVSWIEISLIVGNDYISVILQFLNDVELRATCCDTLVEIISKKMKPENKLQLLSLLNLTTVVSRLDLDGNDLDFVEHIAKLYNAIGLELTFILDSPESSAETKSTADLQIVTLFPFILELLGNVYDDVSCQVFSFLSSYLAALKKISKSSSITTTHLQIISSLLQKIIIKMKFDDQDDGEDEDSISEFNEFRSKLKIFQDTIALINPELYLQQITNVISESIFNSSNSDWRQIELGLFELTNLSESVRNNIFNVPKNAIQESKPFIIFQEILSKTISSNVITMNHPLIQLCFFELIVRHYTFFNNSSNKQDLTNHILHLFTTLGLYNTNDKVQFRCWYLFFRFGKLTKPQIPDDVLDTLVSDLSHSLLDIKAEVPEKDDDSELVQVSSRFDNQLYLFETLGLLISLVNNEKIAFKIKLLNTILNPIFNDLQTIIALPTKTQQSILQAHHSLMAIGTIARGCEYDSTPNKKYNAEVVEKFQNTAEVVLVTLENLNSHESVRDAARFSFARFIPILKNDINSHLSRLISILLASNNLKFTEMTDFLGFIGQIVHNFKDDGLTYQLLNDLFTPLTNKVFQMLNDKGENEVYELMPDVIRDKASLEKAYISLLAQLVSNNVSSLLITQTNKSNLPIIIEFLLNESNKLEDLQISKLALNSLVLFINVFGNDTVNDPQDKYGQGLTIEGISSFLLQNLVKLSFQIPFQNEKFDIKDAQFRFVADELASILKALFEVKREELLKYLKEVYFPQIQVPNNVGDDLISNLINLDGKEFKKYFARFVLQFN